MGADILAIARSALFAFLSLTPAHGPAYNNKIAFVKQVQAKPSSFARKSMTNL